MVSDALIHLGFLYLFGQAENTRKHGLPKIAKTGSTTHSCLPILGNLLNVSQVVDYIRQQESYFIKIQKQSGLRFPVDTYVLNVVPGMSLCQLAYRIRGHPPTGQIEGTVFRFRRKNSKFLIQANAFPSCWGSVVLRK